MAYGRKTGGLKPIDNQWRFWAKVRIRAGCWIWTGSHINKGYGNFGIRPPEGGRKYTIILAHVFAYETLIGPKPIGLVLDHAICDNPTCVNPWHLEPKKNRDNVLRGKGPSAINSRKTHCIRGHEFTMKNTLLRYSKYQTLVRYCRACAKMRKHA